MNLRALAAVPIALALTACTSNPKISIRKAGPDRWDLDIVRCSYDGASEGALADADAVGARRCRRGHVVESTSAERTWLGSAFHGECPAIRLLATVVCKGDPE